MRTAAIILFFFALFSCDEELDPPINFVDGNPNDVEIAVKNESSFRLDSFYINTSGGENLYKNISRNRTSDYKTYLFSYSYFYIRFKADGKEFIHQPIDYVGEQRIENGRYQLKIRGVDTSSLSFSFQLEKDD